MSTLFIVSTPIGNLADITLRALDTLKNADLIACEDTRTTQKLLSHYQIIKPTISYHQHSKIGKVDQIIDALKAGKNVALVTDAGTPGISDPGNKLVSAAIEANIKIEPIPGPSALTSALSISGLPTDRFLFLGFLPHKKGRQTLIKEIKDSQYAIVLYESVHRIQKLLTELSDLDREIVVCRELTKKFETIYRGLPKAVLTQLTGDKVKGEFVVIINKM